MRTESVITLCCAPAGTGKSFRRCAVFMAEEFLPGGGTHCSNFPVNRELMAQYVADNSTRSYAETLERIVLLDEDTLKSWRPEADENGKWQKASGPWDTFDGVDLAGWHIAIDEAHLYVAANHQASHRHRWLKWLGELRHRGATIEFITQNVDKLAKEIVAEAACRLTLESSRGVPDPFFRIKMGDWYELRAAFITGKYTSHVIEREQRDSMGRWVTERKSVYPLAQKYFDLYDSYSAPQEGGPKVERPKYEFERRSKLGLLLWFVLRNSWGLGSRFVGLALLLWLTTGGGITSMISGSFKALTAAQKQVRPSVALSADDLKPGEDSPAVASKAKVQHSEHIDALREKVIELREQRDTLAQTLQEASAVTLITPNSFVMRAGGQYCVGDRINWGPYQGETVANIDFESRTVVLSSGRRLWCNQRPLVPVRLPPVGETDSEPRVSASLPPTSRR